MSLFAVDASNLIASFFEMTDYVFWDDEKGWRIFLMRRREGIDDGLTRWDAWCLEAGGFSRALMSK